MSASRLIEAKRNRAAAADEEERQLLRKQKRTLDTLLQSWLDVDELGVAEQRETLEILMKTLDEDRLSDRPRFK